MTDIYKGSSKVFVVKTAGDQTLKRLEVWLCSEHTVIDKYASVVDEGFKEFESVVYNATDDKTELTIHLEAPQTELYPTGGVSVELNSAIAITGFDYDYEQIGLSKNAFNMIPSISGGGC